MVLFGADVRNGVMCEQSAAAIHAFGDSIDQPATKLEDLGGAAKPFSSGTAQEVSLHLCGY